MFEMDRTIIYTVLGFPEPKWNPTFVLQMKGRPIKKSPYQGEEGSPTGTEELKSTASMIMCHFKL